MSAFCFFSTCQCVFPFSSICQCMDNAAVHACTRAPVHACTSLAAATCTKQPKSRSPSPLPPAAPHAYWRSWASLSGPQAGFMTTVDGTNFASKSQECCSDRCILPSPRSPRSQCCGILIKNRKGHRTGNNFASPRTYFPNIEIGGRGVKAIGWAALLGLLGCAVNFASEFHLRN